MEGFKKKKRKNSQRPSYALLFPPPPMTFCPFISSFINFKNKCLLCSNSLFRYCAPKEHSEENEECPSHCPFLLESQSSPF